MRNLEALLNSDYLIWCVIWSIYLLNSIRLVRQDEFLVLISSSRIHGIYNNTGLLLFDKRLYFSEFLRPTRAVFTQKWISETLENSKESHRRYLTVIDRALEPFRIIGLVNFYILLLLAPALTFSHSVSLAVIVTLPVCYLTNIAFLPLMLKSILWKRLSKNRRAGIILDFVLFPPAAISIVGKLCRNLFIKADLLMLVLNFGEDRIQAKFYAAIIEEAECVFDMPRENCRLRRLKEKLGEINDN